MGELVIQYHEFENAKNELKKFSEQTTTDIDLRKVDDSKGVGEFFGDWLMGRGIGLNHKVTGEELNELTSQIQTHLQGINNTQIKLIKEFGQVYSALEALDKDYIQAILVSIKATEETSKGIQETQGQIKKIVENQRKTLEELKKFKLKLDSYTHLGDIDRIWNDWQRWCKEIDMLSKSIKDTSRNGNESKKRIDEIKITLTSTENKIATLSKNYNALLDRLNSVTTFTTAIEQIVHLNDIDKMWEMLSSLQNSINKFSSELNLIREMVSKSQEDISSVLDRTVELSALDHLMDIDDIWQQTEKYNLRLDELAEENSELLQHISLNEEHINILNGYKEKIAGISHLEDVDSMWNSLEEHTSQLNESATRNKKLAAIVQKSEEEVDKKIADAIQKSNAAVESLKLHIKYAYMIAGGSAVLAIIELILFLSKVI